MDIKIKILIKLFIIISMFGYSFAKGAKVCKKLVGELAEKQSKFVQCATDNAVPVQLCRNCFLQYNNITIFFAKVVENCSEEYFDKDRINIVSTTQQILLGLWDKAFCDDCHIRNNSETFEVKTTNFNNCLTQARNESCTKCLNQYLDLNLFFKKMEEYNKGKVCFDLQDSMNRTRSEWSKELKCCKREFSMLFFLLASSIVAFLPVIFYYGFYFYTMRTERQHDMLIPDLENDTSSENAVASTSNVSAGVSNTNTAIQESSGKKVLKSDKYSDDDVSSDEEPILKSKPKPKVEEQNLLLF